MWRAILFALLFTGPIAAQESLNRNFLDFVKSQAKQLRAKDAPPKTLKEWANQSSALRTQLAKAWNFPDSECDLGPKEHGVLKRDGYRVEKLSFQTMIGVRMTANAYVPEKPGKHPAVLCVHGHWKGAKQDPTVQARCIGLVKLGFFVLCVDAFGGGERAIGTALGEYHGEMVGASLLLLGKPLSGIQVYENKRAVDYLLTRPEVDGERIGITGASGGGNQSMYAGAYDSRIKCVVPVCSVGNYQAYLGAACCMCEVVPGALTFTEESGLLSLVAPRALMVISATRDAFQFSVGEAKKSIATAEPVFKLYEKAANIRHTIFESGHDYSRVMREAMYGWMTLHLKGEGDGSPIPEPKHTTEKPEELRCFPENSRPKNWITIPKFVKLEGEKLLRKHQSPEYAGAVRHTLREELFKGFPKAGDLTLKGEAGQLQSYEPEPRVKAFLTVEGKLEATPVLLVSFDSVEATRKSEVYQTLQKLGKSVVIVQPRATGPTAWTSDKVGRAPDHNTAEWSLWLGRPLLGQWTLDVLRAIDALETKQGKLSHVTVLGEGPAAMVAVCAGAFDDRINKVVTLKLLSSFLSEEPIINQRLGLLVPGMLREVGDVQHLLRLLAPKELALLDPVQGNGQPLQDTDAIMKQLPIAVKAWTSDNKQALLKLGSPAQPLKLADVLK